jgi:hypothetical protein
MAEVTVTIHYGKGQKQVINQQHVHTESNIEDLCKLISNAITFGVAYTGSNNES